MNPNVEQLKKDRIQMEKNWARVPRPMRGSLVVSVVLVQSIRLRDDNRPTRVRPFPPGTLIEGERAIEHRFGSIEAMEETIDTLNGMSRKKPQARVVEYRLPGDEGEVVRLMTDHDVRQLDPEKRREAMKNHPGPKSVKDFPEMPKKGVAFKKLTGVTEEVARLYTEWTMSEIPSAKDDASALNNLAGNMRLSREYKNGCWLVKLNAGNMFLFNLKADAESFLENNEPYRKLL